MIAATARAGISILGCVVAISALAGLSPTEAEKIIFRDLKDPETLRTGCLALAPYFDRAKVHDFGGGNPFRAFATFPGNPAASSLREVRELRALVKASVLSEEVAPDSITFRLTDVGWTYIRPGNGVCVDFGKHDRSSIVGVRDVAPNGDRAQAAIEYRSGFSGAQSLYPWARSAEVQSAVYLLGRFIRDGHHVTLPAVEGPQGWKLVYTDPPRTIPALSETDVLRLATSELSELRSQKACFPLPAPRPQLGIATGGEGGYSVRLQPVESLNSTQKTFRASFAAQMDDWARNGLLEKTGVAAWRIDPRMRKALRENCLSIGVVSTRVVRSGPYQWYHFDAYFKIRAQVQPFPWVVNDHPRTISQRDVAQFISRGIACEGWLQWKSEWTIAKSNCYPAY